MVGIAYYRCVLTNYGVTGLEKVCKEPLQMCRKVVQVCGSAFYRCVG